MPISAAVPYSRYAAQQDISAVRTVRSLPTCGQHQPKRTISAVTKLFKYNDSVVEFIRLLMIRFDFEEAGKQLAQLKKEVESDPFLSKLAPKIVESSQCLYYETYCRIHETLQIKNVSEFTGKDLDEAEQWIVGLIRRSGISVRVDSVAGSIKILKNLGRNSNEVKYAEFIPRTNTLVNNLSRILMQG
jgi:translation initiation factor 3 subunit E